MVARPLRGSREAQFARIDAPVLALDHTFNVVALPSVLDAGERSILLGALRPCERLRRRLSDFTAAIERPCLAAHVRGLNVSASPGTRAIISDTSISIFGVQALPGDTFRPA